MVECSQLASVKPLSAHFETEPKRKRTCSPQVPLCPCLGEVRFPNPRTPPPRPAETKLSPCAASEVPSTGKNGSFRVAVHGSRVTAVHIGGSPSLPLWL